MTTIRKAMTVWVEVAISMQGSDLHKLAKQFQTNRRLQWLK